MRCDSAERRIRGAVCAVLLGAASGAESPAVGEMVQAPSAPVAPVHARAPIQTVGNPVPAVWKERHLDFFYKGRMARYSCNGLRDKVRAMLLDLGARRDVRITALGCAGDRLPVNSASPSLDIVFSAPALPDSAAKPLRPGDLAATDARFVAFTITSDAFRNMGIGDCELVQEFARQILPRLAARNVTQSITCIPYQESGNRFLIQGDILKPLPSSEQPAGQQPRMP